MRIFIARATSLYLIIFFCNLILANASGKQFSAKPIEQEQELPKRQPRRQAERQKQAEPGINCADMDHFCSEDQTGACNALMRAAESGHLKEVQTLLDRGADANARGPGGHSALTLAAVAGHLEIVRALLKAGADPNYRTASFHFGEFSALMSAINRCNRHWTEITDAMIAAGAEVNPSVFSRSPLMYAVERNDLVLVRALLARGADANLKNEFGVTPLMTATISSRPSIEIVKLLLAAGADPNARTKDGETALSLLDAYSKEKPHEMKSHAYSKASRRNSSGGLSCRRSTVPPIVSLSNAGTGRRRHQTKR